MLKMAALAPMPRASVTSAAIVKPGVRRSVRAPYRRSWNSVSRNGRPLLLPESLGDLCAAADPEARLAPGFVGAGAAAAELLLEHLGVKAQFNVEVAVVAAREHPGRPGQPLPEPAHRVVPGSRSLPMTATIRPQSSASRTACLRPERVRL